MCVHMCVVKCVLYTVMCLYSMKCLAYTLNLKGIYTDKFYQQLNSQLLQNNVKTNTLALIQIIEALANVFILKTPNVSYVRISSNSPNVATYYIRSLFTGIQVSRIQCTNSNSKHYGKPRIRCTHFILKDQLCKSSC